MPNYKSLAAQVDTILAPPNGTTATLIHKVQGTYNPASGAAAETVTNTTVRVLLDPTQQKAKGGTAERQIVQTCYCSAKSGVVPQVSDELLIAGTVYEITDVKPLRPAGTNVLFILTVVT